MPRRVSGKGVLSRSPHIRQTHAFQEFPVQTMHKTEEKKLWAARGSKFMVANVQFWTSSRTFAPKKNDSFNFWPIFIINAFSVPC